MTNDCHAAYACDSYQNFLIGNCTAGSTVTAGYHFEIQGDENQFQNYYYQTESNWPFCSLSNTESTSTVSTSTNPSTVITTTVSTSGITEAPVSLYVISISCILTIMTKFYM